MLPELAYKVGGGMKRLERIQGESNRRATSDTAASDAGTVPVVLILLWNLPWLSSCSDSVRFYDLRLSPDL
jgi:hypothetical protein